MQETAQAQSDLVLETVQDKGSMEQAILEMQKRFDAVSVDRNPFPQVCFWLFVTKAQKDTFDVANFQPRSEAIATQAPWLLARVEYSFSQGSPAPRGPSGLCSRGSHPCALGHKGQILWLVCTFYCEFCIDLFVTLFFLTAFP